MTNDTPKRYLGQITRKDTDLLPHAKFAEIYVHMQAFRNTRDSGLRNTMPLGVYIENSAVVRLCLKSTKLGVFNKFYNFSNSGLRKYSMYVWE